MAILLHFPVESMLFNYCCILVLVLHCQSQFSRSRLGHLECDQSYKKVAWVSLSRVPIPVRHEPILIKLC